MAEKRKTGRRVDVLTGRPGRPRVELDPEQFAGLCAIHCTLSEIATYFGVSKETVENRIADTPELREIAMRARGTLRISIRRKQVEMALAGDRTMLIWLGKQYLNQREQPALDFDLEVTEGKARLRVGQKTIDEVESVLDTLPEPTRETNAKLQSVLEGLKTQHRVNDVEDVQS